MIISMSIDNLKKDIGLAVDALKVNTGYIFNRDLIDKLFEKNSHSFENIYMRLITIDSLYSTNMSRRLFGICDLATAIFKIGDDEQIKEQVRKYKSLDEENKISKLLNGYYGISKTCDTSEKARSLISKYLYFVTNHDFPIEDSLVKNTLNKILGYYELLKWNNKEDLLLFLIQFCKENGIAIGDLDNFLWLHGKINKGSLSLLVEEEDYKTIIERLDVQKEDSTEISNRLRNVDYIKKISDIISLNLRKILELNREIFEKSNNKSKK